MQARARILDACKRVRFAEVALYQKPVGGNKIEGLGIRFAEEIAKAFGNIETSIEVMHETEHDVKLRIRVTDLETNMTHSTEIEISKTIERKFPKKGQEVISERENSKGETVSLVKASADEMLNKINAQASKALRNNILRIIPEDIIEEARDTIKETIRSGISKDPKAALKKILDAFRVLNIMPRDIEGYLDHEIEQVTPAEIENLRAVYQALKDGETNWGEIMMLSGSGTQTATEAKADALGKELQRKKSKTGKPPKREEQPAETPPQAADNIQAPKATNTPEPEEDAPVAPQQPPAEAEKQESVEDKAERAKIAAECAALVTEIRAESGQPITEIVSDLSGGRYTTVAGVKRGQVDILTAFRATLKEYLARLNNGNDSNKSSAEELFGDPEDFGGDPIEPQPDPNEEVATPTPAPAPSKAVDSPVAIKMADDIVDLLEQIAMVSGRKLQVVQDDLIPDFATKPLKDRTLGELAQLAFDVKLTLKLEKK